MAKPVIKISGMIFIVIGAGLGFWGYQKSEGFESRLNNVITGSHTDTVMMLYIGAAACLVVGFYLYLKNK